jgi:hypothetical protein
MEKSAVKLVVFNDENFGYWKNRSRNYLLSYLGDRPRDVRDLGYTRPRDPR